MSAPPGHRTHPSAQQRALLERGYQRALNWRGCSGAGSARCAATIPGSARISEVVAHLRARFGKRRYAVGYLGCGQIRLGTRETAGDRLAARRASRGRVNLLWTRRRPHRPGLGPPGGVSMKAAGIYAKQRLPGDIGQGGRSAVSAMPFGLEACAIFWGL